MKTLSVFAKTLKNGRGSSQVLWFVLQTILPRPRRRNRADIPSSQHTRTVTMSFPVPAGPVPAVAGPRQNFPGPKSIIRNNANIHLHLLCVFGILEADRVHTRMPLRAKITTINVMSVHHIIHLCADIERPP